MQGDPHPRHPGARVGRRHQEDGEGDEAEDEADDEDRDADTLEVLLGWDDSHQLLQVKQVTSLWRPDLTEGFGR